MPERRFLMPAVFPALDAPLPAFTDAPITTGAAERDVRLVATGRRAAALGSARAGLHELTLDRAAVRALIRTPGAAVQVRAWPGGWERRLHVEGGTLIERVLVARALPVVVLELEATAPCLVACRFDAERPAGGGRAARIPVPAASDGLVLWQGEALPLPTELRIPLRSGESRRLALLAGPADPDRPAIRALGRLETLVIERDAVVRRLRDRALAVEAPDARVGTALEWAKARLDALPSPVAGGGEAGPATWLAVAALAVGDEDAAESFAARGHGRLVEACRQGWTGRGGAPARPTGSAPAEELVSFPADAVASAPGGPSWAAFEADDPESGMRLWLDALTATDPVPGADADPAAGADPDPAAGFAGMTGAAAAGIVLPLVHGLLGVLPDAPLQRVRLRPRVPAAWDRLRVRSLGLGEAEIALDYRRDGPHHIFTLRQDAGPVPVRVVFEPLLPHHGLAAARVDGHDARLDAEAVPGGRVRVPLQLVLDHDRTMEFHGHEGPGRA